MGPCEREELTTADGLGKRTDGTALRLLVAWALGRAARAEVITLLGDSLAAPPNHPERRTPRSIERRGFGGGESSLDARAV